MIKEETLTLILFAYDWNSDCATEVLLLFHCINYKNVKHGTLTTKFSLITKIDNAYDYCGFTIVELVNFIWLLGLYYFHNHDIFNFEITLTEWWA